MGSIIQYIKESYHELVNKVTWPTWAALQGSTIVVIIATIIITVIIFVMDTASSTLLRELIY